MAVPVDFLTDAEAGAYGRFAGPPSRAELQRFFFLDDADKALIARHRGDHMRLGFALQLTTVRFIGTFLSDPLDVPAVVIDYLAGQLEVADPSCVKRYTERRSTRFEHADEIRRAEKLKDFAEVEAELVARLDAQAWTTGDGPKALFGHAVGWLRAECVLLPGVTTLTRLIARIRDGATERLWGALCALLAPRQRELLESILKVPEGQRVSRLERWRKGPVTHSGPAMVRALERVAEIAQLELSALDMDAVVPHRRVVDLARYGMSGQAAQMRRHSPDRRLATLFATVVYLETKAIDDALELLDVLVTGELVGKAERHANEDKARRHPQLATASSVLATAVDVLFKAKGWGERVPFDDVWEAIMKVVSDHDLREAHTVVTAMVPPPGTEDPDWRADLSRRIVTVSSFLKILTEVIEFDADADATAVLAAMKKLPALLDGRRRKPTTDDIDAGLVTGAWKDLVFGRPRYPDKAIDKNAYVFCVLTQFHRQLKRRGIHARLSSRWRDPRAQLLAGEAWTANRPAVLTALDLPEDPAQHLAELEQTLDAALRDVAGRFAATGSVSVDKEGRLHVAALEKIPDPPSLVDLRNRVQGMLPRVDLPEQILEVMAWVPEFPAAFTAVSGGQARMKDLHISIAACLASQAMNIGYAPIITKGVEALERHRLGHVAQNYLRAETFSAANAALIEAQARIPLAQAWGGGLVAAIDGMRFVVASKSIYARPNSKYFGRGHGFNWLNMINDQSAGIAGMVVSGAPKESLHMIDVMYRQDGGQRPDIVITDEGSYSDLVFGLVHLLGRKYRPALADIPDHKLWRIKPRPGVAETDYGPLNTAARGRLDLAKVAQHWPEILRVAGSIHTGTVRAYDVIRMLHRDGHPTPLGEAIATYGRIFKTLHVLAFIDDETYRRDIKGMRNLQEGRHSLAERICHGKKGEIYQRYHAGMEDQLSALGLVLNLSVLWTTSYTNAALDQLRASGHAVGDEDVARLSAFMHKHVNVLGRYSFVLPELPGGVRELRDPDADGLEEED